MTAEQTDTLRSFEVKPSDSLNIYLFMECYVGWNNRKYSLRPGDWNLS